MTIGQFDIHALLTTIPLAKLQSPAIKNCLMVVILKLHTDNLRAAYATPSDFKDFNAPEEQLLKALRFPRPD